MKPEPIAFYDAVRSPISGALDHALNFQRASQPTFSSACTDICHAVYHGVESGVASDVGRAAIIVVDGTGAKESR